MRLIGLLLSLVIIGYLWVNYLNTSSTETSLATSRPKQALDRAQQEVDQALDDYQKKMNNYNSD